jgi:hypothetical protein
MCSLKESSSTLRVIKHFQLFYFDLVGEYEVHAEIESHREMRRLISFYDQ